MPLFNIYLLGKWFDEVLYLPCGGIMATSEDVKENVHSMIIHPYVGCSLDWIDVSFFTVQPVRMEA